VRVRLNKRIVLWVAGITIAAALLITLVTHWTKYKEQREAFAPIFTLAAELAVAGVTFDAGVSQKQGGRSAHRQCREMIARSPARLSGRPRRPRR
jgi:hypothetical protein